MKPLVVALGWGVLFGAGLVTAGLIHPQVIQGYLDVTGAWDPTLLIALCTAVAVYAPLFFLITRRQRPVLAACFALPNSSRIDLRLIAGAATFGAGWGLAGMCPGANLAGLAGGGQISLLFLGCWLAGTFLGKLLDAVQTNQSPASDSEASAPQSRAFG